MLDFEIRNILKTTLLHKYYADTTSKVVEEFEIPAAKARIDMAVINGYMHGYEIKSSRDTLQRLPSQLNAYSKVFDYLSVVTENKYENKLLTLLPDWVGIYSCTENGVVSMLRASSKNNNKEAFHIAKLLWRPELIELLTINNIKFKKAERNWLLCENLAQHLELSLLENSVRQILKNRTNWKL